jgi:hypothetical protein
MKEKCIDPRYQQVYEIREVTDNLDSHLIMEVIRNRNVKFYFSDYEGYEFFKKHTPVSAIVKTQFSDRGWALVQIRKALKISVYFKKFDTDFVFENCQLIHTKRGLIGVLKSQNVEICFDKFEILETFEWELNGINATKFLSQFGLTLPFI